jgi:RNA polymerase-interacting CarD/CdnL/TRCF family regulator
MFSKAKKILASELMYARDFSEDQANAFLEEVLENIHVDGLPVVDEPLEPVTVV